MSGRIRTIKPEWMEDEELLRAGAHARVLSVSLMLLADDYGNGRCIPEVMGPQVFPFEESSRVFRESLARLSEMEFVVLYQVRRQTYFHIKNWKSHQRVDKPGKPRVPGPEDEESRELTGVRYFLGIHSRDYREGLAPDHDPDHDQDPDHDPDDCGGLTPPPQTADGLELVTPSKPTKRKPQKPVASSEAWKAYAEAYRDRYGCDPIRNAKVNGQLSQFVQRVPRDEAPQIVRHYLRSHNARYTASGHSVGCLLQDAEKLRTEALTGRATTSYAARQADAKQGRGQKYAGVIAKLEREAEEEERQAREVSSGNA